MTIQARSTHMKALLELLDQLLYLLEYHDAPDSLPLGQQRELKHLLESLVREALNLARTLRQDLVVPEEAVVDAFRPTPHLSSIAATATKATTPTPTPPPATAPLAAIPLARQGWRRRR